MKIFKILFLLLTILSFSDCNSTNKNNSQLINEDLSKNEISKKECNMDAIKIFDIERFKKNSREGLEYSFTDSDGNFVNQFQTDELYIEHTQNPKGLFYRNNEYDIKSGILRRTGLCQKNGGMQYGIWKSYNDAGHLVQEINYETPYGFTWEAVLEFMNKENVDFDDSFTYITRVNSAADGKYWVIIWDTKNKNTPKPTKRVHFDGDSGKVIFESYYEGEEY